MTEDNEGFRYPVVDEDVCIDCGLCKKVCPIIHATPEDTPHEQEGFLLQHKDDAIRQESTSGGAFTALATWVIEQGGVVFGGGFKAGTQIVVHQMVDKVEDLAIFRNSKYVQSLMGDSMAQALKFLKEDRWVLFSATPCQMAGFHEFLRGKVYQKLICVDLVCHGIPSPRILAKYLAAKEQETKAKPTKVLFRDKWFGYQYSSFSIYHEDSSKDYHKGIDTNAYLRAYFSNLSVRPSCYDCKFKKRYRQSDLTIWDCFPIHKFTSEFDDKGTTRVLVQSEKGRMIMDKIKNDVRLIAVDPDKLVEGEREIFRSVPINEKRDQFFADCNSMEPRDFFKKWFPITPKVWLNGFIRRSLFRLGLYSLIKRCFMLFYTRKDARYDKKQDSVSR